MDDATAPRAKAATAPGSFTRPGANGAPLRGPVRTHLPGRGVPIVEGFHVRETPSIQDRVVQAGAMLFGGGRPETCDEVRQRLVGARPGLARDMDLERLARLCTQ